MKVIGWLLFVLYSANVHSAGEVEIPLLAETTHIQSAVSRALEFDQDGQGSLGDDQCNRVDLSDLKVATEDTQLSVGMALTATTGAYVLGACRVLTPWQGRLAVKLTPRIMASGLAIEFVPNSIELLRPDDSPGILSKPAQLIAEALVLPRMKSVQIDLAKPLNNIDELIQHSIGSVSPQNNQSTLVHRTRITRLQTEEMGIKTWLSFQVSAPELYVPPSEPSLNASELAQWQTLEDELDGFLTTIISTLAHSTNSLALRLELLAILLDARHAISEALTRDDPQSDPVRELFLTSWERLRPLMSELESLETPGLEIDFRLAAFIAGGDVLRALDALGPEYGLEITRNGLRRLARLLLADEMPPSFTPLPLEVDPDFRDLFGFKTHYEPVVSQEKLAQHLLYNFGEVVAWLFPATYARNIAPAEALKGLVPQRKNLNEYLELVANLLQEETSAWLVKDNKLPDRLNERLDPLVRATAWKESCWRQFIGSSNDPQVLRSPVGAVGMMQINGRVWRKVYDLDRLVNEVDYNVNAGIDILTHYMIDYAIRRGEHEHPGGDDNLIKATYAAYNGGPGQLARYRRTETPARLQAIDNAFWSYYASFNAGKLPDISGCYVVGR